MKLSSKMIALVLLIILFGGIGISKTLGFWQTTSSKIPATFKSGQFAGQYNPADIRGSYSFGDISQAFDIPVGDLAEAFALKTGDPAKFLVKDLGTVYASLLREGKAIETDSVRYFVALYKGLPFMPAEDTYLPNPAVNLLKAKTTLTPEQTQFLESHAVDLANVSAQTVKPGVEDAEDPTDTTIKGKTTFKEILDWGVPKETIEKIIGSKIPTTGTVIRDYCQQNGLDFSTIKTELQAQVPQR